MEFYKTGGDVKVNDLQGTTDLRNGNNDSSEKMLRIDSNEMASEEFSNPGEQYGINIDEMKTVINSHQSVELSANNNDSMDKIRCKRNKAVSTAYVAKASYT